VPDPPAGPLVAPYAVETILDELSMPTPVVRDGEVVYLAPMSDAGTVEFGPPAGPAETIYTIHSEQATFAQSFGARNVSFQLSLNPAFLDKIRFLAELGLAGLACGHDLAPLLLEGRPQPLHLRRLAGAVHSLEGDEHRGTRIRRCARRSPGERASSARMSSTRSSRAATTCT